MVPAGITRVPQLGVVHHATDEASISPISPPGEVGPQRQKSEMLLRMAVWQLELGPTVVELQMLTVYKVG